MNKHKAGISPHTVGEKINTSKIKLACLLALRFMVPTLARFSGERLRARFGGSVAGENGLSSIGSEHSEAVDDVEFGESLKSTPFLADVLM